MKTNARTHTKESTGGELVALRALESTRDLRPQNMTRIESEEKQRRRSTKSAVATSDRATCTAGRTTADPHSRSRVRPRKRDLSASLRLLVGVGVGADLLATGTGDDVDETTVVLPALLSAAGQGLLAVLLLGDLGGLALDLTGTCQRTVDLTTTTKAERQVKRALVLDAAT